MRKNHFRSFCLGFSRKCKHIFPSFSAFAGTYEIFVGFKELNFALSVLLHRNKLQLNDDDGSENKINYQSKKTLQRNDFDATSDYYSVHDSVTHHRSLEE
jgi:hypothetical protein